MENVEKILCCDRGGSDGNNMWPFAAMMNGGMNGQWNNPFIYLVWMMFAGRFFGNNGWGGDGNGGQAQQNIELQSQLSAIRAQMSDNQNSNLIMDAIKGNNAAVGQLANNLNCDFNAIQGAIFDVRSGIDKLAGEVGFSAEKVINAVGMGNANLVQALQNCCCTTQKSILEMGYQNQLANCQQTNTLQTAINTNSVVNQQNFTTLGNQIQQGFCQVGYNTQSQTCDIINAGNANTQRIIDTLNTHWSTECSQKLQDAKFEISQLKQNQYLASIINGGCGCSSNQ
jgi:hypothetical protein